jgi:hypothetical protein
MIPVFLPSKPTLLDFGVILETATSSLGSVSGDEVKTVEKFSEALDTSTYMKNWSRRSTPSSAEFSLQWSSNFSP